MKTTLEIDDTLYREVKAMAALTGRKMKLPLISSRSDGHRVTSAEIDELGASADLDRW